jgi:hypothetical protein
MATRYFINEKFGVHLDAIYGQGGNLGLGMFWVPY